MNVLAGVAPMGMSHSEGTRGSAHVRPLPLGSQLLQGPRKGVGEGVWGGGCVMARANTLIHRTRVGGAKGW